MEGVDLSTAVRPRLRLSLPPVDVDLGSEILSPLNTPVTRLDWQVAKHPSRLIELADEAALIL